MPQSGRGGPFSRDHTFTASRSSAPEPKARGRDTGTVFSVTMGKGAFAAGKANAGKGGDSKSNRGKKIKAKPAREKKERVPKEKSVPVDASALDNDMDSYFAARAAAAKE